MYTAEEFDNLKQKVLKYVLFKKRTEQEVKQKFVNEDTNILEDMIEFLKQENYIDDKDYIRRSVNEFLALRNLSLKEIKYKLYQKGVDKYLVEEYFQENTDSLYEYEKKCARNIYLKKSKDMEPEDIEAFLYKKGYMSDSINSIYDD